MRKNRVLLAAIFLAAGLSGCSRMAEESRLLTIGGMEPAAEKQTERKAQDMAESMTMENIAELTLPANLPDKLAGAQDLTGEGGYLLLGELPAEDIALYCDNLAERNRVYLRYGDSFQEFSQQVWTDTSILPELELWETDGVKTLTVRYLRHEGTYFDGSVAQPGLVCELVMYQWENGSWTDIHFHSSGPMQPI